MWHWVEAFYKVDMNLYVGLKILIMETFYKAFDVHQILLKMDKSSYRCNIYCSLFCWGGNGHIDIGDNQVYVTEPKSRNSLPSETRTQRRKDGKSIHLLYPKVEGVRMRVGAKKCIWPIVEVCDTKEQIAKFVSWSKLALS